MSVIVGVSVKRFAMENKGKPGKYIPEQKKGNSKDLPLVLKKLFFQAGNLPTIEPRGGQPCPACGEGILEYDGLLNLTCTSCHASISGNFT